MDHLPKNRGIQNYRTQRQQYISACCRYQKRTKYRNRGSIAYYWTGSVALIGGGFVKFEKEDALSHPKIQLGLCPIMLHSPFALLSPKKKNKSKREAKKEKKEP